MGNNKKKKKAATIGAVTLAAALVLTGTYAWNSISQKAKNENIVYTNPGGRLHDDWNGTKKMVYVENFTGAKYDAQGELVVDGSGQPVLDSKASDIFVRVRLQQYMEFGEEAGEKSKPTRNATLLVSGTTIEDPDDWPVYKWQESSPFTTYLDLKMASANQTTDYLPTFNKNQMSLIADINGTYEGTVTGDEDHFDDYKAWKKGDTSGLGEMASTAYYYSADNDAIPAGKVDTTSGAAADQNPGAETTHKTASEKHSVTTTLGTEKVISMEEWLALPETQQTGNFWVWDEDGWAYWANPVSPNTATGPLLTEVSMKNQLGTNCYYAINVVGEFASAGDWGKATGTNDQELGFYLNGITEDGLKLLNKISNTLMVDNVSIIGDEDVLLGDTMDYQAVVTLLGDEIENQKVTWSLDGNTSADTTLTADGKLTVSPNEGAEVLTITAVSEEDGSVKQTKKIYILRADTLTITAADGATKVQAGAELKFNAQVFHNGTAVKKPVVTWSVSGGTAGRARGTEVTSITEDGILQVSALEEAGTTLTVTAVPKANKKIKNEYQVTIEGPDSVSISPSDISLDAGGTQEFTAKVSKDGTDYASQEVEWSVAASTGNAAGGTSIDENGKLTIDEAEPAGQKLIVTAASKNDPSKSASVTVTVATYTIEVSANGSPATVAAYKTQDFTANVLRNGTKVNTKEVAWSVSGGTAGQAGGTKIDSKSGTLTVGALEVKGTKLEVKAVLSDDAEVSQTCSVTVGGPDTVTVTAAGSATEIELGKTLQFSKTVKLGSEDYSTQAVTWELSGNSNKTGTTLTQSGLLTVASDETAGGTLTIKAVSKNDPTLSASANITVVKYTVDVSVNGNVWAGSTPTFFATLKRNGSIVSGSSFTWESSGGSSATSINSSTGVLTIDSGETAGTKFTITATSTKKASWNGSYTATLVGPDTVTVTAADDATEVGTGETLQFSAKVKKDSSKYSSQGVTWSLSGKTDSKTSISTSGLLTVGEDETVETLTVTAKSKNNTSVSGTKTVTVNKGLSSDIKNQINTITPSSSTTISIDGIEFYVVAKQNNQALLLSKYVLNSMAFGSSNGWQNSNIRTYLNKKESGGWLYDKPKLQKTAISTEIKTLSQYNSNTFVTTNDQIFLLSEADLFGTSNGVVVTDSTYYTAGKQIDIIEGTDNWRGYNSSGNVIMWWARSPRGNSGSVMLNNYTSYMAGLGYWGSTNSAGVRPALWVKY